MKQIKILAKEFLGDVESAKRSTEGGDLSVLLLERWFSKLGVWWVLHVADGTPSGEVEHALDASSLFPAFTKIVNTFRGTLKLLHGHGYTVNTSAEEEQPAAKEWLPLASFTQQAMLKMLTFVDSIVVPNLTRESFIVDDGVPAPAPYKLHNLLRVHEALSQAFSILSALDSSSSAKIARIQGGIVNLLSAKEGKVGEAIWSALEEIRTRIVESLDDGQGLSCTQTPQGSSDIDEATKSVMEYVMFLDNYYSIVEPIVSKASSLGRYVPQIGDVPPLTSLEVKMVYRLLEKLANKSEAFPDQGLREDLGGKVEGYTKRYIRVSWEPVLSCLINPTPTCFGKNHSPLPKFESEFQKIYTTQKLWKVPHPELRIRLRKAIIDEVIPCYTRCLADDYGNAPPKFSPSNLQEMLQELFEG
ncbi:hypothetical protein PVAP13_7KG199455 [Panicum virgatum]|uniref:Exocyst subunit Exo70 family protein n=1 Tax=Panicum virgatum TaxID=38727 RepID=A0A8T0QEQ7_PANVG|nr:hypothetical protein PVAP13_7KG199455 [Panicum virgatum]KAG2571687.1 hypothetical protein PVAP13_7KG199455 [Panicum virgatum]KAG2571688.1 hypothetical protein PVAP13_7KG199455 [Panicum virgatum]